MGVPVCQAKLQEGFTRSVHADDAHHIMSADEYNRGGLTFFQTPQHIFGTMVQEWFPDATSRCAGRTEAATQRMAH